MRRLAHLSMPKSLRVFVLVALALLMFGGGSAWAQGSDPEWDGRKIIAESLARHQQFPFVYEEQTMVLMDASGHRDVRRCRRFTRSEQDGTVKFLLVFDDPAEIRGVALLAIRAADGSVQRGVYLPAFGPELKVADAGGLGGTFLGTDFAIEDLTPEEIEDHAYERQRDRLIEGTEYFVVDAMPADSGGRPLGEYGKRRHFVRKDSFMIVQTDIYDTSMRFFKRITHHDLNPVDARSWRANMIIAHDRRESHRTLLKVDRRVYSHDYVPQNLFELDYLLANRHVKNAAVGKSPAQRSAAERTLMERFGEH